MPTLDSKLRKKLEDVVVEARDVAEAGARDALQALTVHEGKRGGHLSEAQAELRNRLRIHGRQLGDERRENGDQAIDLLVEECAYEHWHRMLFSRFLATNDLLVEPQSGMAISLEDVTQLATEENIDPWQLAASFATGMLPQIFRIDSPALAVSLPTERRKKLEELLESLSNDVFAASDSLGWVYQFWQAKRKKEVNESEVKIGATELPAVTQLFTEPYMVSFLLDNSLGAWWASRRLSEEDLRTATSEQELREKAALKGVPLEYLRFVRTSSGHEIVGEENTGPWTPAAGTFDAWPKSLSELKTLDPCCGSGHFLVAALLMLVPMRIELEGLSVREAVDRVLSENLYGLEIDQRCVELAAFALALTAWNFSEAGGYRELPDLNVACCGLSVSVGKEEWTNLAGNDNQLKIALDWMYEEFKDARILGSLFDPANAGMPVGVHWSDIAPLIRKAIGKEKEDEAIEAGVVARGIAKAVELMVSKYSLIVTNVPYLGRKLHCDPMIRYADTHEPYSKADLATIFISRIAKWLNYGGSMGVVSPQNWHFLNTYRRFREQLLNKYKWDFVIKLGPAAFDDMNWWAANTGLLVLSHQIPTDEAVVAGIDVAPPRNTQGKATLLRGEVYEANKSEVFLLRQIEQQQNPSSRIVFRDSEDGETLGKYADCLAGLNAGDINQFIHQFWERILPNPDWQYLQNSFRTKPDFGGMSSIIFWEDGRGKYYQSVAEKLGEGGVGAWIRGAAAWNHPGVVIVKMKDLQSTRFVGNKFGANVYVIVPKKKEHVEPIFEYSRDPSFLKNCRQLDQKTDIANQAVLDIPFELAHWQNIASKKYPYGLPEPYSDDPTQWLFHGHPASSVDALQVAVARLLGYRWPAELDTEMELATDSRAWIDRSAQLNSLVDDDGIVCIPAVASEQPADGRLLSLLHQAFEDGVAQERVFSEKIEGADEKNPLTLDLLRREWKPTLPNDFNTWFNRLLDADGHKGKSLETWLRDKFFESHCKCFNQTPFIWHIWDGHREGFSAIVNYHKLAGSNGRRLLEKLTHSYLGDWINRQQDEAKRGVEGADGRLIAARNLKAQLELILAGEPPFDIFVRWKPLHEQPIGWEPDINDGVRLNIRPFMAVDIPGGKKGAGILRVKPNTIKWTKDRGKEPKRPPEDYPWFWGWDEKKDDPTDFAGGDTFTGDRWNDLHYTNAFKLNAREAAKNREAQS
jgi:hypothetical protein